MGSKSVITQVLTRQGQLAKKTRASTARLYRNGLHRNGLKRTASFLLWGGLLGSAIAFTATAYLRYQQQFLTPSVALVLGGAPERERFAAKFAQENPNVEIWVSSGSNPEYAQWVFEEAHIPTDQWQLDYEAVDTVTNFTTLVDKLEAKNVDEVYLLTSDYHMRRASVVAQIVLGSRGIEFKPVEIPTEQRPERPETVMREVRDGARSLLWVVTGKTGSELKTLPREKS
ncbi:MAG: YdcF family protein [Cyanobacteria bacterium J06643_4]